MTKPFEILLWSIALPGFGQFLNKKYVKAIVFVVLEVAVNLGARLNLAIMYSFKGNIQAAIDSTNYQWLMFYPCIYMFAIWDSFKDAGGAASSLTVIPFVLCAYLGTVGIMYSDQLTILGVLLGPVWLPMLFAFIGLGIGGLLKRTLEKRKAASPSP